MKCKFVLMIILFLFTFTCKSVSQKIDIEENNYNYLIIDSSLISPLIETTNGLKVVIMNMSDIQGESGLKKENTFYIHEKYFLIKIPRRGRAIKLGAQHTKLLPFWGGEYYSTQPKKDKGSVAFVFSDTLLNLEINDTADEPRIIYLKLFFSESQWSSFSFTDIFFTIFPFPFLPPIYYIIGASPGFYYKIDLEKNIEKIVKIDDFRSVKFKNYGRLTEVDQNGIFQFVCNDSVSQGEILYISKKQKVTGVGVIVEKKNKKCSSLLLTNDLKFDNEEFLILQPEKR